ncbi:MAG: S41 family peptidase [Candidatus Kaiserbacteria bacterium]|nr:MAG: S41 family peptidase [Candidatus Kaiserbacteria bacterium]
MPNDTPQLPFRSRSSASRFVAAGVLIALLAFGLGYTLAVRADSNASGAPEGVDFSPVWKAWQVIDEKFVPAAVATSTQLASSTEEAAQERVWGMVQGLAGSLQDPYTFFLPPKENEQFAQDMSGAFEGVGMEIAVRDQILTVVSPLKGTPAERAGIKSGDKVLKIDDLETRGIDVTTAVSRIRGPKGSAVKLLIAREGWSEPREISVVRDVINVPVITTEQRADGIFVIGLLNFTANSPELFRGALREFVESGSSKLVLDLRGNPGGYLEAAVDMASWFLPSGRIVVTEDYAGHAQNIVHRSRGYDVFNENLKMVVLVDRGTASASEILAEALRYWGVAQMVGDKTFGKGSVQELVEITPETALKITVARWLAPSGEQIPTEGITPDQLVAISEEDAKADKDPQMGKAVEILNQ